MDSDIEDAIIIAAGNGTRMLPASLYTPKEFLPLVDIPAIHHLIWEVIEAGIKRIHIVISDDKLIFVERLASRGKELSASGIRPGLGEGILSPIPEGVQLITHIQEEQNGVGGAIRCSLDGIRGGCLVLLGDNIMIQKGPCNYSRREISFGSRASLELVEKYGEEQMPVAGIYTVPEESVSEYGVVGQSGSKIVQIIEKPAVSEAPSNYVLCGRYVFPPGLIEILDKAHISSMGNLQSIGMLLEYANGIGLEGVVLDEYNWYDFGNPIDWMNAQIDHLSSRVDLER